MRSYSQSYTAFRLLSLGDTAWKNNFFLPWMAWCWAKGWHPHYLAPVSDKSYSDRSLRTPVPHETLVITDMSQSLTISREHLPYNCKNLWINPNTAAPV